MRFGETSIHVVPSGTVVGKAPDGADMIVSDESAIFDGNNSNMWVTQRVYDLLKSQPKGEQK
jgi:hypothetical protein